MPPRPTPIGTVRAGALLDVSGAPLAYKRSTGEQYWMKLRLVPKVYLQSPETSRKPADELVARLAKEGYEARRPELLSSAAGLAQVRWFHDQDREPAQALAGRLTELLERQIQTLQIRRLRDRADPGTLEVWLDPGVPQRRECSSAFRRKILSGLEQVVLEYVGQGG